VRNDPGEFADAVAWLDHEYSEAALCGRKLKDSEWICRRQLREFRAGRDPCDTFPRRKTRRHGTPRAVLVEQTIGVAHDRGLRLRGDQIIISNDRREDDAVVDAGNLETAWRSMDEKCRQNIRHIKDERRERDARIRGEVKNRMGRFLEAVRDTVDGDIPAAKRLECSRRLVLLAAMIGSPEPLSLSVEFRDMPWESKGNILCIGGPYVPGREELFEKHDSMNPAQWSIARFLADGFGNLVARAVAVLEQTELTSVGDGEGPWRLFPPFFVIEPETTFADAWEVFCCEVLNRREETTGIHRWGAPEGGVDLYWREKRYAYQCKSVEDEKGQFNVTKAVESIKVALETRKTLPWDKYYLCSNVGITGRQGEKLRQVLREIELLTPDFWVPRCREQWAHVKRWFRRLEPVGKRR
jgi:hypothetical protein